MGTMFARDCISHIAHRTPCHFIYSDFMYGKRNGNKSIKSNKTNIYVVYTHRENRHNVCTVYGVYGINYELKMHENHRRAFIGNIQQTENSGAIQNIKRLYNQNLIDTVQMNNVYGESESLVLLISTFFCTFFLPRQMFLICFQK